MPAVEPAGEGGGGVLGIGKSGHVDYAVTTALRRAAMQSAHGKRHT